MDLDEICDLLEQDKLLQNAVHFSLVDDFVCTYTNAAPVFKVHNALSFKEPQPHQDPS
ncbi:hypothetical protein NHP21011_13510 [Helicobacter heilmannii]|uniref:hypothetical protein n=1 Tax=Helicobacter heilmannii TaxID=35817 RepID=UPI00244D8E3A|nr:hypothetical protein [Helicobacter heilmannii]GMB95250.1 hypothetical protein NHP21011_13510 [Helicobacter heilmannii]